MKKVVHLITLLELGGAQGNTIHTVQCLNPKEYESHLWSGQGAYWDKEIQQKMGPSGRLKFFQKLVRNIHPIKDFLAVLDLIKALKALQPDILHTHSSKAGILGRLAGHLAGVPMIVHTFHGFGFNDQQNLWTKGLYVFLEKKAAKWADALVFVSLANKKEALRLGIGGPSQYHLIRSGVPMELIRRNGEIVDSAAIKKDLSIPSNHKVVVTLSAFKPQKNLLDFLEIAKQVKSQMENVSFLLVGDGEQREALEECIRANDLSNTVKLLGWRKDATNLLAASDLFVLTSLWEGLPRAMLEAMILGKPSVCYETDGVKDLLGKGGGVMVRQKDIAAMTKAIVHLLSDPKAWQDASREAKSLLTSDFDIDEMVRAQEKLYFQLNHS